MAGARYGIDATVTVGGTAYRVLRYGLRESVSEVSSSRVAIVKADGEPSERVPDPASLVDQVAILTLESLDGSAKRTFVGTVARAERTEDWTEITIEPKAWRMSRRADCRIFQKMAVPDIVKKVLGDAGVDQTEWKTSGSYAPRDYVVQYRETDLAFVARLLSEEGIYFAIHHDDANDTVVFGDDPKGLGSIEGNSTLDYKHSFGVSDGAAGRGNVTNVSRVQQVRSDKTTLRDYDPDKPKLKLESTAKADKAEADVYVWPGRFKDAKVGDRYAQVLLDSIRADRDVVTGHTDVLTLVPGATFTIQAHPYAPMNQEYLVVAVEVDGRATGFRAGVGAREAGAAGEQGESADVRFRAIPTKVAYRPPRVVRERFVPGTQTAMTTGSAGEEIHTDAGGHVKAQFFWDRLGKNDDNSSCWMRTSQLPAGGSMLLPRMKWEVSVRYLEGDVDRPYVMGRMYNAVTMPPYSLPDHKGKSSIQTATTPGGGSSNEIRTCDDKGKEEMFMNASKDMSVDVGNNTTESIKANLTRSIGANHNLSITDSLTATVTGSQTVNVGGQQAVHVQTFMVDQVGGNHSLTIGGARSMKVGGDHKRDVTGDSTLKVGALSIDLVVGSSNEHALGDHKHDVGAALVEMTAGGRSIIVGGNSAETELAKLIVAKAGRAVDVTGGMNAKVGGLIYRKIGGDLTEKAGGNFTEVAAGAQILKADNITVEAETSLTVVMGASVITMKPAMITIAGVSIKADGEGAYEGAMILDN